MDYRLYGMPGSLYTAKARSYLIKQGAPFQNRAAGEARFLETVVPAVGRWIIPVLETPDGDLIQDGAEIIASLEARGGTRWPAYPTTPRHRVIGQVFELFGGEGLLRPAMHYRWNFDETNQPFIARDFVGALAPGASEDVARQIFEGAARRMRRAMASFGVNAQSIPLIEAAYEEFLDLFDAHLAHAPYLLGGRPTLGDYGLIGPLFAHLARDPYPARLMKQRAQRVWRWVERMNSADLDSGDHGWPAAALFADDGVPETLSALLSFVARDYLPEVRAYMVFADQWLADRPELPPGENGLAAPGDRAIGKTQLTWRGVEIEVAVMPYRIYLLQKVQAAAAASPGGEGRDLLERVGLGELLTLTTRRPVERLGHLEVWGAARG
jgi:glutathione S-transferase